MDASLQLLIDEVTGACEPDAARELWEPAAGELSFHLRRASPSFALDVRVDVATVDDVLVSALWAWRGDDGDLHVSQNAHVQSGLADTEIEPLLELVARELPARVASALLAEFD